MMKWNGHISTGKKHSLFRTVAVNTKSVNQDAEEKKEEKYQNEDDNCP